MRQANNNIILIGFMGVGKGTIARALSKKTKMFGLDTDDLIESIENRKITEIFANDGEAYFRKLERETAKWLEKNVCNTIISTGGGFYKVKNLQKIGTVVYLESSFEAILKRLKNHPNSAQKLKKRPLLEDIVKAKKLYKERVSAYKKLAHVAINVEGASVEKIVKEIQKELGI